MILALASECPLPVGKFGEIVTCDDFEPQGDIGAVGHCRGRDRLFYQERRHKVSPLKLRGGDQHAVSRLRYNSRGELSDRDLAIL